MRPRSLYPDATVSAIAPFVFVSGYSPEIICCKLDTRTGKLTEVSRSCGGNSPSFLAWSPEGKTLYAVNEGNSGQVMSFAINSVDGRLTKTGECTSGGNGPCHVSVHASGRWVFAANYASGHVAVLSVRADGSLQGLVDVQMAGRNAHMTMTDKSGALLFVPTLGLDQVQVYGFDANSGRLSHATSILVGKGAGPRHCALTTDEKHLHVINELDSSITTYSADLEKVIFTAIGTISTVPADFRGKNSAAHIVISPDGQTIYGSNRGHDSLVICRIAADGSLVVIGHETAMDEFDSPRNFTMTPDGTMMLVVSQKNGVVSVMSVARGSGRLSSIYKQKVGPSPSFVGLMTR